MTAVDVAVSEGQWQELAGLTVRKLQRPSKLDPVVAQSFLQDGGAERLEGNLEIALTTRRLRVLTADERVKLEPAGDDLIVVPDSPFVYDKTADGWELLEDCAPKLAGPEDISRLTSVMFHEEGEDYVLGERMVVRSRKLGERWSQRDLELMEANQERIPKALREFVLVATGTIWLFGDGDRIVACLVWHGLRWKLFFSRLAGGWGRSGRLPSLGK